MLLPEPLPQEDVTEEPHLHSHLHSSSACPPRRTFAWSLLSPSLSQLTCPALYTLWCTIQKLLFLKAKFRFHFLYKIFIASGSNNIIMPYQCVTFYSFHIHYFIRVSGTFGAGKLERPSRPDFLDEEAEVQEAEDTRCQCCWQSEKEIQGLLTIPTRVLSTSDSARVALPVCRREITELSNSPIVTPLVQSALLMHGSCGSWSSMLQKATWPSCTSLNSHCRMALGASGASPLHRSHDSQP